MPRHRHCTTGESDASEQPPVPHGAASDATASDAAERGVGESGVTTVDRGDHPTRRHVLHGAGAVVLAGLAGCLGGDGDGGDGGDAPDAITVPDSATCDVCGMVIVQHPGPSAEIFYEDEEPAGHENPARFDSTWEAFQFDFERSGWSRSAFYVTDYSAVDYEIRTDDGQQLISRHADAADFVDATDVTFVVGSEVLGTMGRDLIAFTDEGDAEAFADEHGGNLGTFDDVTPELISSLGM
jgi:copper chaperone NosL